MKVYIIFWIKCWFTTPAPKPLTTNTGPKDGSLKQATTFFFNKARESARDIAIVVFSSPALVGVIAVHKIIFPFLFFPKVSFEVSIFNLSNP